MEQVPTRRTSVSFQSKLVNGATQSLLFLACVREGHVREQRRKADSSTE